MYVERFHALDAAAQLRVCDSLLAERAAQRFTWITAVYRGTLDPEVAARVVAVGPQARVPPAARSRAPRLGVDRAKVTAMVLTLLAAHPVEADDDPGDGATLHTWSARVEDSLVAVGPSRVLEAPPLDAVSHEPAAVVVRAFETLCARRGGAVTVRDLLGALDNEVRDALEALEPGVLRGARAPHRLGRLLLRIARSPVGGRRLSLVGSGALGNRWSVRACVASLSRRTTGVV